jgi:multidrug efflux pump subunit AcrA (membrane-fusion protein)
MKQLILLLLGAVACVAAGVTAERVLHIWPTGGTEPAPAGGETTPAEGGRRTVAALGRLEPEGGVLDVGVGAGTPDRLERLLVSEGQRVEAGQEPAYLESYRSREAEKESVAAQLAEARARLASESAYWQTQLQEARVALESAEKLPPLDLEAQEATVRLQEAEFTHAEKEVKRSTQLKTSDASTQQDLDNQNLLLQRSREALSGARVRLRWSSRF